MANDKNKKRPPLDFERVKAVALQNFHSVVEHWAPGGKREGKEWVMLNPKRADNSLGSFSINMNNGAWKEFATGDCGRDLISWVRYMEGTDNGPACVSVAKFLGIDPYKTANTPAQTHSTTSTKPAARRADNYRAVMPVPAAALAQRPRAHSSHGTPSQVWEYRSSDGGLLFCVCRFDGKGERGKTYAPLSFGEHNGRITWNWKAVPTPRPLYGLDKLAANPAAVVVLVEGEKSCDNAAKLFPGCVAMSWAGGAKAIGEADFSPLGGREIYYWPDADRPGAESIPKLATALQAARAGRCSLISITPFAEYRPSTNANGAALEAGGEWPDKSDAADAVAMGWTADHIALLQQRGELLAPFPAAPTAIKSKTVSRSQAIQSDDDATPPYRVSEKGVFIFTGEDYQFVCDFLEVIGLARSIEGGEWSTLVRFHDYDGADKQQLIPLRLFAAEGAKVIEMLLSHGLRIGSHRESKRKLLTYLQWAETPHRVRLVSKLGWQGPNAFMLRSRIIGAPAEDLRFYSESAAQCKTSEKGVLADWREKVSAHAASNPLLCFAISAALASPLLDPIGSESAGFYFFGETSLGKSTILKIAASVCGDPAEYPCSFRTTDNALESTAAAHSDCPLILDEFGELEARIAGPTIYMLANGMGKARANENGGASSLRHRWRLFFLASGEELLVNRMAEIGKKPAGGMEVRFITIPACFRETEEERKLYGIFDVFYPFESGSALSKELLRNAAQYHGTALPAFLEKLLAQDREKITLWLIKTSEQFAEKYLTGVASGQVRRVADKFALVAAAGELAIKWGIVNWCEGEAVKSAGRCFAAWLDLRGGEGNHEERQILEQIRHHFDTFGESRYTRWEADDARTDEHAARTMERYGFRKTQDTRVERPGDTTENIYYVFPSSFRKDVCKGLDHKRAARLLAARGALLKCEKDRFTGKARLPGAGSAPVSCYIVNYSALFTDDENETAGSDAA